MLRKIVGAVIALALVVCGAGLIGGWIDAEELTSEGGHRRGRISARLVAWLVETLGPAGAGAVLCALAVVVAALAFRTKADARGGGVKE